MRDYEGRQGRVSGGRGGWRARVSLGEGKGKVRTPLNRVAEMGKIG